MRHALERSIPTPGRDGELTARADDPEPDLNRILAHYDVARKGRPPMNVAHPRGERGDGGREKEWWELEEDEVYLIENRTPFDIELVDGDRVLLIPGLAARKMSGARLKPFEHRLLQFRETHRVRVDQDQPTGRVAAFAAVLVRGAVLAVPTVIVVRFVQDDRSSPCRPGCMAFDPDRVRRSPRDAAGAVLLPLRPRAHRGSRSPVVERHLPP